MTAIEASVNHLEWFFTTIMALAIAEGLKQFVMETRDNEEPAKGHLRWWCFIALFALLAQAMPFTYAMTRYFFLTYRGHPLAQGEFKHLAVDTLAFTLEAIGFFVMSRSLYPTRALVFTGAAIFVYLVDLAWVAKLRFFGPHGGDDLVQYWIRLDPIVVILLGAFVLVRPRLAVTALWQYRFLCIATCVVLTGETVADLSWNWRHYFPPVAETSDEPSEAADLAPKPKVYFAAPLFTQGEWRWNARLVGALRQAGYEVIAPQEAAVQVLGKGALDSAKLFRSNVAAIESCSLVVAVLDGPDPDSGTAWECGYAHKIGRPIVGIRTDLRAGGDDPKGSVNLMLIQCCNAFVTLPTDKRDDERWLTQRVIEAIKQVAK